jgi:hypothetical protein
MAEAMPPRGELLLWRFVFTTRGVDAFVSEQQSLDGASTYNVGFHNFIHVGEGDSAVPHSFWINYQIWTVLALVEASRLIGPNFALKAALCDLLLE